MKYKLPFILFLFILTDIIVAQTGTIKIAKPKQETPPKDTVISRPHWIFMSLNAGGNYTFKKNNKSGIDAGITFYTNNSRLKNQKLALRYNLGIGLQYSLEYVYFALSPYNLALKQPDVGYSKTQNKMEFFKLPVQINHAMVFGARMQLDFSLGMAPEYLINGKNEYNRLIPKDYNQFNLAGLVGVAFSVSRRMGLGISYSKDFFQQLKDVHVYDNLGNVIGKQDSRISLLSVSLRYGFAIKKSSRVTHIDKRVL